MIKRFLLTVLACAWMCSAVMAQTTLPTNSEQTVTPTINLKSSKSHKKRGPKKANKKKVHKIKKNQSAETDTIKQQ